MNQRSFSIWTAAALAAGTLIWALAGLALGEREKVIFAADFETARDTVGWQGWGQLELRDESPPGGGAQALWVSGGCFAPHAGRPLEPVKQDRRLILRAMARSVAGGLVELDILRGDIIYLPINSEEWQLHESKDTLFCAAGETPRLAMVGGGIVSGGILVDRVEVVQVP
jgi:hypothetical protein